MMDGAILVSFSSMKGAGSSYVCEGKAGANPGGGHGGQMTPPSA